MSATPRKPASTPKRDDRKIGHTARASGDVRQRCTASIVRRAIVGLRCRKWRTSSRTAPIAIGRSHDVTDTRLNSSHSRKPPVTVTDSPDQDETDAKRVERFRPPRQSGVTASAIA